MSKKQNARIIIAGTKQMPKELTTAINAMNETNPIQDEVIYLREYQDGQENTEAAEIISEDIEIPDLSEQVQQKLTAPEIKEEPRKEDQAIEKRFSEMEKMIEALVSKNKAAEEKLQKLQNKPKLTIDEILQLANRRDIAQSKKKEFETLDSTMQQIQHELKQVNPFQTSPSYSVHFNYEENGQKTTIVQMRSAIIINDIITLVINQCIKAAAQFSKEIEEINETIN